MGKPPVEPPVVRDPDGLAPGFAATVEAELFAPLRAAGWQPRYRETLRTAERVAFLYGFGRSWDDGRGIVTNVNDPLSGFHFLGLAGDLEDARYGERTPVAFYTAVRELASASNHLTSGDDWDRDGVRGEDDPDEHFHDLPHVQWFDDVMMAAPQGAGYGVKTPSAKLRAVYQDGGIPAVWAALRAA